MIGGFTMSVFEEYFKKYDGQKWEQAKEAKPSIGIGMAEKMIDIYDLIAQVSKIWSYNSNDHLNNLNRKQMRDIMKLDAVFVLRS